jgi:hypothetical protein
MIACEGVVVAVVEEFDSHVVRACSVVDYT